MIFSNVGFAQYNFYGIKIKSSLYVLILLLVGALPIYLGNFETRDIVSIVLVEIYFLTSHKSTNE